ncbi:LysR substrate-binding domain-containing protein [Pseudomonas silvicola]|nr:LysR substrate-binding domain-containing protein [Pseudomonas silvicola]
MAGNELGEAVGDGGIPSQPSDLLNHSCLHYRWQNSGKLYQWPFKKQQAIQAGESLPVTMVCSNVEALIYLAQAGRGIACVPDFAVKDSLAAGRLEKVLSSSLVGGVPSTSFGQAAGNWRPKSVHL